ncbi:unnamed protein product [Prunus armeniaca]
MVIFEIRIVFLTTDFLSPASLFFLTTQPPPPPPISTRHLLSSITTATLHSGRRDRTQSNHRRFLFQVRPSSAVTTASSHRKTQKIVRVLTDFLIARSPSILHQIGRVRNFKRRSFGSQLKFQPVLRVGFRPLPVTFWGRSKNKSGSKLGVLSKLGVWAGGLEFFRPP